MRHDVGSGRIRALFAFALAALAATPQGWAISPDGYYDLTWPTGTGGGYFAFDGATTLAPNSVALGLAIEANGKIFLSGTIDFSVTASSWWMGELNPDGSFVPTFGLQDGSGRTNGCAMLMQCEPGPDNFSVQALGDGRYLVLGAGAITRTTVAAHGYEASTPTNHFSIDNIGGALDAMVAAAQADGKTLVAGTAQYSMAATTPHFGAVRLDAALAPDPTFNATTDMQGTTFSAGALYQVDVDATSESASAIVPQPGGRNVLVGVTTNTVAGTSDLALLRIDSSGQVDPTFGNAGRTIVHQPGHTISDAYALLPTVDRAGRILVATIDAENSGMLVTRITADGSVDLFTVVPSSAFSSVTCQRLQARVAAVDSAGRILVGGRCANDAPARTYFAVIRLRGDTGQLDPTFGIGGASYGWFDSASSNDYVRAIAVAGRPIVAGWTYPPDAFQRVGVARLDYDLIYTDEFESTPRGCLPPNCN